MKFYRHVVVTLVLLSFNSWARDTGRDLGSDSKSTCGTQGTLRERILNCALKKGQFSLVMRNGKGEEFYRDGVTGNMWSNILSWKMNGFEAAGVCSDLEVQGLNFLSWKIPSGKEFLMAYHVGITRYLPGEAEIYGWNLTPWTASEEIFLQMANWCASPVSFLSERSVA